MDRTAIRKEHLDALTGLRYLAAMSVVITHMAGNQEVFHHQALLGLSSIGMPTFFTLSGFLMCYNYYHELAEARAGALRRFYVARFARIYPAYLLALLLSFSFMGNFFHDLLQNTKETLFCLGLDLTLTQSWLYQLVFDGTERARSLSQANLGIAWSISTEVFFYATFPLTIPLIRRFCTAWSIVAGIAALWTIWALLDLSMCPGTGLPAMPSGDNSLRWLLYYSPYGRIGEFWIGCLVGKLFVSRAGRPIGLLEHILGRVALWGCLPLIAWFVMNYPSNGILQRLHYNVGLAPLCACVIYCLSRYRTLLSTLLGSRPLILLGEASYCLYLLHPLAQSYYEHRSRGEGDLTDLWIMGFNHIAMLIVLHAFALGVYWFYERPIRSWIQRWLGPRTASREPVTLPVVPLTRQAGLARAA